jgi:hypothetical protein
MPERGFYTNGEWGGVDWARFWRVFFGGLDMCAPKLDLKGDACLRELKQLMLFE